MAEEANTIGTSDNHVLQESGTNALSQITQVLIL